MACSTSTKTSRIVALVDMDCFYVQVEERDDPSIKGKPAAVVQYKAYKGGGIIAVNYEARAKGVSRHLRGDDAKAVCPEIILVRVPETRGKADLTKYRDAGKQVIQVLCEFSNCVERASIDEAYIDLTEEVEKRLANYESEQDMFINYDTQSGIISTFDTKCFQTNFVLGYDSTEGWLGMIKESEMTPMDDLRLAVGAEIVGRMREAVFEKTGFRCSAGIAHNKVLAKLCAGLNKPNKQTVLPHAAVPELWTSTQIKKVRNLGGKLGDCLIENWKCEMMSDLLKYSEKDFIKLVGSKAGTWIYQLVRGYDDEPVNPRLLAKSIGCNKNFMGPEALTSKEKVKHWLQQLTAEVLERLQKDFVDNNRRAKTLTLHITFEERNSVSKACRAHYNSERIFTEVWSTMERLYQQHGVLPINMLGLIASNFEDEDSKNCAKISKFLEPNAASRPNAPCIPSSSGVVIASSSAEALSSTTNNKLVMVKVHPEPPRKKNEPFVIPGLSPSKYSMTQECERCGTYVPILKYVAHMDYHIARDLSREINGLPALGFDLRPATLEAQERERYKEEREQRKALQSPGKKGARKRSRHTTNTSKKIKSSPAKKVLAIKPIDSYFLKKD